MDDHGEFISLFELDKIINKKLDIKKSQISEQITNKLIRRDKPSLIIFSHFFCASILTSILRTAKTIMLYKAGKPKVPVKSYTPSSLTSCPVKYLGKAVADILSNCGNLSTNCTDNKMGSEKTGAQIRLCK